MEEKTLPLKNLSLLLLYPGSMQETIPPAKWSALSLADGVAGAVMSNNKCKGNCSCLTNYFREKRLNEQKKPEEIREKKNKRRKYGVHQLMEILPGHGVGKSTECVPWCEC